MKNTPKNFLIAFFLFAAIVFIGTCTVSQRPPERSSPSPVQDSLLKHYEEEKLELQRHFEVQLQKLEVRNDSLSTEVAHSKRLYLTYRIKANSLQSALNDALVKADTVSIVRDTIRPLVDTYFEAEAREDSTCNATISAMEKVIGNRDSAIVIEKGIADNLRDLKAEQEMRVRILTEQLNTAYKVQKRKTLQNKLLAGGLILLSGISSSLLIIQTLK
mgnify:CR=1 FL=1